VQKGAISCKAANAAAVDTPLVEQSKTNTTRIAIQGLRKVFPTGTVALEDIDLEIADGEFVSIVGPSGCGKTTLLRMLAGLESPDSGSILLDGADISHVPPHLRPTNMMFQSYALFPHLDVAGNIAFGLKRAKLTHREIDGRVAEMLALVEAHAVSHQLVVPTMFVRLLKLPEAVRRGADTSSLRTVVHAAAPCPVLVKRAMTEWWGTVILEFYAGSEGNGFCAMSPEEWLAHPGSVGRPLLGIVHITNDDVTELPVGEVGTVGSRAAAGSATTTTR